MDGVGITNNLTLYLMLIICIVLLAVDSLEIYRLIQSWGMIDKIDPVLFSTCYQKEFIIKTTFSIFSLLAAVSAAILTLFLTVCMDIFLDKFISAYIQMNYFIFGLIMLGFSTFGLIHWTEVVYVCDKKFMMNKEFSLGNMFSLLCCFILSLTITIGVGVYETITLYVDSILRREGGNKYLRQMFWWAVFRGRGNENIRNENAPQNENENRRINEENGNDNQNRNGNGEGAQHIEIDQNRNNQNS